MARKSPRSSAVIVIGLGRFGSSVADSLVRMGHEVLGVVVTHPTKPAETGEDAEPEPALAGAG